MGKQMKPKETEDDVVKQMGSKKGKSDTTILSEPYDLTHHTVIYGHRLWFGKKDIASLV